MKNEDAVILIVLLGILYFLVGLLVAFVISESPPTAIRKDISQRPTFPIIVGIVWPLSAFAMIAYGFFIAAKQLYIDWIKPDPEVRRK